MEREKLIEYDSSDGRIKVVTGMKRRKGTITEGYPLGSRRGKIFTEFSTDVYLRGRLYISYSKDEISPHQIPFIWDALENAMRNNVGIEELELLINQQLQGINYSESLEEEAANAVNIERLSPSLRMKI